MKKKKDFISIFSKRKKIIRRTNIYTFRSTKQFKMCMDNSDANHRQSCNQRIQFYSHLFFFYLMWMVFVWAFDLASINLIANRNKKKFLFYTFITNSFLQIKNYASILNCCIYIRFSFFLSFFVCLFIYVVLLSCLGEYEDCNASTFSIHVNFWR